MNSDLFWRTLRGRQLIVAGAAIAAVFIGTAVAGANNAVRRDALVRARVWCEAVVSGDALRYQDTFRRGYFRGTFDRFANQYREPKESAIRAQMPRARTCAATGVVEPGPRGDVYVPVKYDGSTARLRMRRESGFLVVVTIE
jgi:hypothetical protein